VSAASTRWVTLGRVSGVFGVKGWLKIQSYTHPRSNIAGFGQWLLRAPHAERAFAVETAREHETGIVAKLRGLDDRDRARDWVGAAIVVERDRLPPVPAGEFYWTDLEGLEVRTTAGLTLGKVDHLLATGAHDVLVVRGDQERLIPFVTGAVVERVDLAAGLIVVNWAPDY
jgi:16S rRNA processing protein RimM